MTRLNPLSDKRASYLISTLSKQPEPLRSQLITLLPVLGSIDPTSSGEYVPWLLRLYMKQDYVLPEDAEKLQELLVVFSKNKHRLPPDGRDINRYKTHSDLYRVLKQFEAPVAQQAVLRLDDVELVADISPYQMFRLMSVKAVQKAAAGTNWCVKAKDVATEYLKDGPLFLVLKKGEKYALVHYESGQVMDVDDEPIKPNKGLRAVLRTQPNYMLLIDWLTVTERRQLPGFSLAWVMSGEVLPNDVWGHLLGQVDEKQQRLFAADCAEHVLHYWEDEYPDDDRPRTAIETARRFARGEVTEQQLYAAWSAARSAAWSAAKSAAKSAARDAARAAAWSATRTALDAAWSAAGSAAESVGYAASDDNNSPEGRSAYNEALRQFQLHFLTNYLGVKHVR